MDLSTAADELYAADPSDFVAVRTRLAAAAGAAADPELAAQLKGLRKPTVVAWLLNRVARREPEVITDLLDLGGRMRTAQSKGDGAALAAARPERHEAIQALVAAARRSAEETGTSFASGAADGVGSTAIAALADPASGEALASGRLLRPLAYAGFGEVELEDAVAVLRLVPPVPDADEPGDVDGAEGSAPDEEARRWEVELDGARDVLRERERELGAARLAHSEAASALEAAADVVARLEAEVTTATERVTRIETRPGATPAEDGGRGAGP